MLKVVLLVVLPALCLAQTTPGWHVIAHDFFEAVDMNDNGAWTRIELDQYFQRFDNDRDGRVSFHEFVLTIEAQAIYFVGHETEWYDNFDYNHDGHLDHIDFNLAFLQYDLNQNGIVSLPEFEYAIGLNNP